MYVNLLFFLYRDTYVAFDDLDFSKKWFHIALHISRNESSLFLDGELLKAYVNNIDLSQNVDLNITLGGKFNIVSICPNDVCFEWR